MDWDTKIKIQICDEDSNSVACVDVPVVAFIRVLDFGILRWHFEKTTDLPKQMTSATHLSKLRREIKDWHRKVNPIVILNCDGCGKEIKKRARDGVEFNTCWECKNPLFTRNCDDCGKEYETRRERNKICKDCRDKKRTRNCDV